MIENYRVEKTDDHLPESDENEAQYKEHELDNPKNREILSRVEDWWYQARLVQSESRYQQAIDDDFYDGLQWSEEDKREVESRGQAPLVFNEVKRSIDWIIGTERRTRIDYKVYPRTDDDRKSGEVKTSLMKYISDVNKTAFMRSRAFADAARVGIGWLEDSFRTDPTEEPIFSRSESWRNMWYDHLSIEPDLSDARYVFRAKWVDQDIAETYFPERKERIQKVARKHDLYGGSDDDEFFLSQLYYVTDNNGRPQSRTSYIEDAQGAVQNRRPRVRLVECWYRMPVKSTFISSKEYPQIHGDEFSKDDHQSLLDDEYISVHDGIRTKVFCAVFVEGTLLQNMESPFKHDSFPFTPVWGFKRKRDGAAYGVIRNQRDPQEDLNKRRSKAQFILSANQILAEEGAFLDKEEAREEAAAPDGILEYKKGYKVDLRRDNSLAREHIMLEQSDKEYIRDVAGVTGENLGEQTNATSGKAIQARQNEGTTSTTELFDNLRYATQLQGEKTLSMIEQTYTDDKVIRIIGERGAAEYLELNKQTENEYGEIEIENDITATKADFVVDATNYNETVRAAMFEQLIDMVGKLDPTVAFQMLDLVFDMSDIPGKEEIVARIRKLNGETDPNAEETPEYIAEQEAKAQQQQEQEALAKEQMMIAMAQGRADLQDTQTDTVSKQVETMQKAMEVAQVALADPTAAVTTDEIINQSKQEVTQ
jgi:hypothetical protein